LHAKQAFCCSHCYARLSYVHAPNPVGKPESSLYHVLLRKMRYALSTDELFWISVCLHLGSAIVVGEMTYDNVLANKLQPICARCAQDQGITMVRLGMNSS
jgi:hypothetical protein